MSDNDETADLPHGAGKVLGRHTVNGRQIAACENGVYVLDDDGWEKAEPVVSSDGYIQPVLYFRDRLLYVG